MQITFNLTVTVPSIEEALEALCPNEFEPKTVAQAKMNLGAHIEAQIQAKREAERTPVDMSDIVVT
jgi:hypothetical protein